MEIIKKFFIIIIVATIIILGLYTNVLALEDEDMPYLAISGLVRSYVKDDGTFDDYLEGTPVDDLEAAKEFIEGLSDEDIKEIATWALALQMADEEEIYIDEAVTSEALNEIIDAMNERIEDLKEQQEEMQEPEESPAFSGGSWVNPNSYNPGELSNAGTIINFGNSIIGIVQFVGTFASVIVLIILGIKYMLGSVEEKAEYKKTMWPYLIGAILVFATTTILSVIETISKQI